MEQQAEKNVKNTLLRLGKAWEEWVVVKMASRCPPTQVKMSLLIWNRGVYPCKYWWIGVQSRVFSLRWIYHGWLLGRIWDKTKKTNWEVINLSSVLISGQILRQILIKRRTLVKKSQNFIHFMSTLVHFTDQNWNLYSSYNLEFD